jgi:hypothetical protein
MGFEKMTIVDLAGEFFDDQDPTILQALRDRLEEFRRARYQRLMEVLHLCSGFVFLVNPSSVTEDKRPGVETVVGNFLELRAAAGGLRQPFVLGLTHADRIFPNRARPPVLGRDSPYLWLERAWPNLAMTVATRSHYWKVSWVSVGRTAAASVSTDGRQFFEHPSGPWGVAGAWDFIVATNAWGVLGTTALRRLTMGSLLW